MKADSAEIIRALAVILSRGQVVEVRALEATTAGYAKPRTLFGYFNDATKLAAAVQTIASAKGIYFTLNPVNPALLARACNRLKDAGKNETTSDGDVVARRWLPVDCDPVRPAGISADDYEHDAAIDRACAIRSELKRIGWPEPIIGDSGNGGHLLFLLELSADDCGLVAQCLAALAALYSDRVVKVDTGVFNLARIWKLYGTWACKGDSTRDRSHRLARLIDAPAVPAIVPMELLQALAAQAPARSPRPVPDHGGGGGGAWLDEWLCRNAGGLPAMRGPDAYQGGRRWVFETCPWNSEHRNGSAFLIQRADGIIQAGCHHNGCTQENWHTLRAMIEPRYQRSTSTSDQTFAAGDGVRFDPSVQGGSPWEKAK